MALERDPNALSILLRNQPQIPLQSEQDYALEEMIPEEQLFQAQEAYGRRGAESGGAYTIPSRESLKRGGMAELRKLFGIQQGEAQAKALPARIAGEYGLETARTKGGFDVEAARQKAIADAAAQQSSRQFQQEHQGRQQAFSRGEGQLNRQALAGRATQAQGATQAGREYTQGQINQRAQDKKPFDIIEYIKSAFGGGSPAAPAAASTSNIPAAINSFRQHPDTAQMSFEQLMQSGELEGATPQELAEFQQAWGR